MDQVEVNVGNMLDILSEAIKIITINVDNLLKQDLKRILIWV